MLCLTFADETCSFSKSVRTIVISKVSGLTDAVAEAVSISIFTQVAHEEGRPDIEINIDNQALVHIEVKHDAGLGSIQLERYAHYLQKQTRYSITRLVLLSRSNNLASDTTLTPSQYHHVCWYEVHQWLLELYSREAILDEVGQYFVNDFTDFLELKGMVMKRISWEYMQGVPALYNLGEMIEETLREVFPESQLKRTCGWNWRGFYILNNCFVGVYYAEPSIVVFANNGDYNASYRPVLDLEQSLFFAMTPDKQYQTLILFFQNAHLNMPEEQDKVENENIEIEGA